MEDRVRALEVGLAAKIAADNANNAHLSVAIASLENSVAELTDALNRSKGALWVLGIAGAIASAVTTFLVHTWTISK